MKKSLFTIMCAIIFCAILPSCEKDDIGGSGKHKYTVTWNIDMDATVELRFYEYNDKDEMINYNTWENVQKGMTKTFRANNLATKLVVYIKAETEYGDFNRYVSQIFYLSKNTNIYLDGETLVSKYSPL